MANVEVTGAARLYSAASVWTAGLGVMPLTNGHTRYAGQKYQGFGKRPLCSQVPHKCPLSFVLRRSEGFEMVCHCQLRPVRLHIAFDFREPQYE
jgi:hypothetical protein